MTKAVRNLVIGIALAAPLGTPAVATAQTDLPTWTCRASAGYLTSALDDNRHEPLLANGVASKQNPDRPRCADDDAGAPEVNQGGGPGDPGSVYEQGVSAKTTIDPDLLAPRSQRVTSEAFVNTARVQSADGGFVLTADNLRARAEASCTNGVPSLSSSGSIGNVALNGQPIAADDEFQQVGDGVNGSPLGGLIRIRFNEVASEGDGGSADQALTRRAIHVTITAPDGTVLLDQVLAEAKVDRHGDVCNSLVPSGGCPAGTTFDPVRGACILTVVVQEQAGGECPAGTQRSGDACVRTVITEGSNGSQGGGDGGPRGDGGFIVRDDELGPLYRESPCRKATALLIIGSSGRDRITGTDGTDRVFALGAKDRVSGGRGHDCLEGGSGNDGLDGSNGRDYLLGGSGNDTMSGGLDNDRLVGKSGKDKLQGGSGKDYLSGGSSNDKLTGGIGNDRMLGGSGNDILIAAGKDMVSAGSGRDVVNAATQGPGARINCGSGRDTVRINRNERRRLRGCERIFVVRRSR
jgi:hypothetical protein